MTTPVMAPSSRASVNASRCIPLIRGNAPAMALE
jgi:hypothetical protein